MWTPTMLSSADLKEFFNGGKKNCQRLNFAGAIMDARVQHFARKAINSRLQIMYTQASIFSSKAHVCCYRGY